MYDVYFCAQRLYHFPIQTDFSSPSTYPKQNVIAAVSRDSVTDFLSVRLAWPERKTASGHIYLRRHVFFIPLLCHCNKLIIRWIQTVMFDGILMHQSV